MHTIKKSEHNDKIKNKKILLVNFPNPLSHGGAAIAISLIKYLRMTLPEAYIDIMTTREFDVSIYTGKYGFNHKNFIKHNWFRSRKSLLFSLLASCGPALWVLLVSLSYNLLSKLRMKARNIYENYNIVLDLSSDSLNEYYGLVYPLFSLFELELLLLSKKKVVVCPASIGPFKNKFMKRLVRYILSRTALVIAREETTLSFLRDIGIPENKLLFAADLAFLFTAAPKNCGDAIVSSLGLNPQIHRLVGVAPSSEIFRYCFPDISDSKNKYQKYIQLMAEATDFIIEKFNADVILIPHFIFPNEFIKNDKIASQDIYNHITNKARVKLLLDDYRADEVKSVIGLCDIVISCRMHAAIASTSSTVPTVALSFGHKFHSVLGKMLGQEKCIVNTNTDFTTILTNLKQVIINVWTNKTSIKEELKRQIPIVQNKASTSFDKINELLENTF